MGNGDSAKHSETSEDSGARMQGSQEGCWIKQTADAGAFRAKGGRLTSPRLVYLARCLWEQV